MLISAPAPPTFTSRFPPRAEMPAALPTTGCVSVPLPWMKFAPLIEIVPLPKVPAIEPTSSVPPVIEVVPVKPALPPRIESRPAPVLTRPPAPESAPIVASAALPVVSVAPPSVTLPPAVPPPVRVVIVWLKPFKSSVAPATSASVTPEEVLNDVVLAARSVPAETVVAPE